MKSTFEAFCYSLSIHDMCIIILFIFFPIIRAKVLIKRGHLPKNGQKTQYFIIYSIYCIYIAFKIRLGPIIYPLLIFKKKNEPLLKIYRYTCNIADAVWYTAFFSGFVLIEYTTHEYFKVIYKINIL